jgi:hypothetical protein
MGDPIVELPLDDPKRLAVFQNPPLHTTVIYPIYLSQTLHSEFSVNFLLCHDHL